MGLSVGDGFRFGCGLMLVVFVFYLVVMAVSAVIMVFMAMLGLLPLLFMPQTMSLVLPLA